MSEFVERSDLGFLVRVLFSQLDFLLGIALDLFVDVSKHLVELLGRKQQRVVESNLSGAMVVGGYAFKQVAFELCVLDLLLDVQIDCVVVGCELVALEKLDCGLV